MKSLILRQPVFDAKQETVAFRLSYGPRPGTNQLLDADVTATRIIADLAAFTNLEPVAEEKKAFVPVTRDVLINEFPSLLRPNRIFVDVTREQESDELVVDRCRKLAGAGYALAVDHQETPSPLSDAAELVKFRVGSTPPESIAGAVHEIRSAGRKCVAVDVPTWDAYRTLAAMRVDFLSGDFYARPESIVRREIPTEKLNCMRVVVEAHRPDIDLDELERIIKLDASLTYKLLQYINSSHIGARQVITSLHHALVMMGQGELRRWVALVALTSAAEDKPASLVVEGMIRARFAELMAPHVGLGERDEEMFLIGLLSVLEAVFDRPISMIVSALPLARDIQHALTKPGSSGLGTLLYAVLAYARGNWRAFDVYRERVGLDAYVAPACYHKAAAWAHENSCPSEEQAA